MDNINILELKKTLKQTFKDELDVNTLINTLDTRQNDKILDKSKKQIQTTKNKMLQSIGLEGDVVKDYHHKLKEYMYVDDISELNYGAYIRWISLHKYNIDTETVEDDLYDDKTEHHNQTKQKKVPRLEKGGFLADIMFVDGGILLRIQTITRLYFNIYFDKCMIFQRLDENQQLLLELLEYTNN